MAVGMPLQLRHENGLALRRYPVALSRLFQCEHPFSQSMITPVNTDCHDYGYCD